MGTNEMIIIQVNSNTDLNDLHHEISGETENVIFETSDPMVMNTLNLIKKAPVRLSFEVTHASSLMCIVDACEKGLMLRTNDAKIKKVLKEHFGDFYHD